MDSGCITIATPRLLLRPWRDSDLVAFAAMNADPRVMEFLPKLLTRDESDALAMRIGNHFAENGFGLWAVEIPGTAEFIGFVGLAKVKFSAHFTPNVEIGWRLAFEYWGKGYAAEAARAAVNYGFNRLGLNEIVAFTVPANARSIRIMQKLAMTYRPADDFDHPGLPEGHRLRRHVLYRLKFVREATPDDVDAMFDVRTSVRENLLNEEQMRQLGITRDSVAAGLRSNLKGWIIEQDGQAAGFSLADRNTSSIFALFVRPEFERRGLGSALLQAAVSWLWGEGKERIRLSTGARSHAVQFYEKRGWNKIDIKNGEWQMEFERDAAAK